jgi:DNA-binding PucR family transcriptional regulator
VGRPPGRGGAGGRGDRLAGVAARASRDARGAPADLLEGYLELLAEVSLTGRRLTRPELAGRRAMGARAAERGVPLRATVDIYLSATWLAWPVLPGVEEARGTEALRRVGERIFRAADASIVAVVEGYEVAQRLAVRREEAHRREFVDDLLVGRYDASTLAERSQRYGLPMVADYQVAVAEADRRLEELGPTVQRVERDLLTRLPSPNALVTTKEGALVCIAAGGWEAMSDHLISVLDAVLGREAVAWRVALGRPHRGLGGVRRSFEEARTALELAQRLGLTGRPLKAADLLVFEVLLRDVGAITELVGAVLDPLRRSRLGAAPFLETLTAYFAAGGVATAAARELRVGVRTVTHRLARIRQLTGYAVDDPLQRYTLETAVLGARLLGWPENRR